MTYSKNKWWNCTKWNFNFAEFFISSFELLFWCLCHYRYNTTSLPPFATFTLESFTDKFMGEMYSQMVTGLVFALSWRLIFNLFSDKLLAWWKPAEMKDKTHNAPSINSLFHLGSSFKCFALGQQYPLPLTYFVINRLGSLLTMEKLEVVLLA